MTPVFRLYQAISWLIIGLTAACGPLTSSSTPSTFSEADGPSIQSYDDILALIRRQKESGRPLRKIDDLLTAIKAQDPSFLRNYAMVYASRSLQSASFQRPRVILFGGDEDIYNLSSHLVMAFNGEANSLGYEALEIMSFDDNTQSLAFREILFPGDASQGSAHDEIIFRDNPKSCATCHGVDSKPIWDTYNVWPGVYGSIDDRTYEKTPELIQLKQWKLAMPHQERYRHLDLAMTSEYSFLAGFPGEILRLSQSSNTALTMLLSDFNYRRIARNMQAWPEYDRWKYGLLAAAGECDAHRPEGFFPPELRQDVSKRYDQLHQTIHQRLQQTMQERNQRYFQVHAQAFPNGFNGFDSLDFESQHLDEMAHYAFYAQLAGQDLDDWSMSFTQNAMAFSTGLHGISDLHPILRAQASRDQALKPFVTESYGSYRVNCDALRQRHLTMTAEEEHPSLPLLPEAKLPVDRQAVILRCASCHTNPYLDDRGLVNNEASRRAPFYPFHRPDELRQMLKDKPELAINMRQRIKAPAHDSRRMPPAPLRSLTETEVAAWEDFLDTLTR